MKKILVLGCLVALGGTHVNNAMDKKTDNKKQVKKEITLPKKETLKKDFLVTQEGINLVVSLLQSQEYTKLKNLLNYSTIDVLCCDEKFESMIRMIFNYEKLSSELKLKLFDIVCEVLKKNTLYKDCSVSSFDIAASLISGSDFSKKLLESIGAEYPDTFYAYIFNSLFVFLFKIYNRSGGDKKTIEAHEKVVFSCINNFLKNITACCDANTSLRESMTDVDKIFAVQKIAIISSLMGFAKVHDLVRDYFFVNDAYPLIRDCFEAMKFLVIGQNNDILSCIKEIPTVFLKEKCEKKIISFLYQSSSNQQFCFLLKNMIHELFIENIKNDNFSFLYNFFTFDIIQKLYYGDKVASVLFFVIKKKQSECSSQEKIEMFNALKDILSKEQFLQLLNVDCDGEVVLSVAVNNKEWKLAKHLIDLGATLDVFIHADNLQKYYDVCMKLLTHDISFFYDSKTEVVDVLACEILNTRAYSEERKCNVLVRLLQNDVLLNLETNIYSLSELACLLKASEKSKNNVLSTLLSNTIQELSQKNKQKELIQKYLEQKYLYQKKNDTTNTFDVQKTIHENVLDFAQHDCSINFATLNTENLAPEIVIKESDSTAVAENNDIDEKKMRLCEWMGSVETAYDFLDYSHLYSSDEFVEFLSLLEKCKNPQTKDTNKKRAKIKLMYHLLFNMKYDYNEVALKIKQNKISLASQVIMMIDNQRKRVYEDRILRGLKPEKIPVKRGCIVQKPYGFSSVQKTLKGSKELV